MDPKRPAGQQGADSGGGNADVPDREAGNPADLDERIASAVERALAKSVPAIVNASVTDHLKRQQRKAAPTSPPAPERDDDDGDSAPTPPAAPAKPAGDSARVKALQRQLDELTQKQQAAEAKAAAMAREKLLRDAIAGSGVSLVDTDAAYRIVVADLEPDEEGGLRPRDAAQQGKAFGEYVKERLGGLKYLHAASGRAGGDRAGEQKPDAGGFREDPNASDEENIRRWRESQAAKAAG